MSPVERSSLADGYDISRLIRGGWQLAGGHGAVDRDKAVGDLLTCFDAGVTTFDGADIYTGVEDLYGALRAEVGRLRGAEALAQLKIHTKFVPNLDILPTLTRDGVRAGIERSLSRLGMERLDLVQLHWWDYDVPRYVETALWLDELREEGKIHLVGATNLDTVHMQEILAGGVALASLQMQYSLLDNRPETGLLAACERNGVAPLCYGSVAGGFLSETWLGAAEPKEPFENRSLTKYKLIIDDFGGWELFQDLLRALRQVAKRHGVDIASIATRAILDEPGVVAVIVGGRSAAHLGANVRIFETTLDEADRTTIDAVLARRHGPNGEVYGLERDRLGRHGKIMRYNLAETGGS